MTTTDETSTGETYTHRAWLDWAETSIERLQALWNSLDQMAAQIGADDGDQAQIGAIRSWQAEIEAVITGGRRMVDDVNATQVPVGEAVAAAGGSDNTPHKQYADEARSA
jgi:hypothetical protein